MNVVLEALFLRRPRIEYVSPPVCPIQFSASGVAIFDQCFNDQVFCSDAKINSNFLNFQQPPDGFAYNIYFSTEQSGAPFQLVIDGLRPAQAVVFTAGTYWMTINTAGGESIPFPPTVAPGEEYVMLTIPTSADAVSWNLYKDGALLIGQFTGTVVESSAQGWYQATKITADGETPLSGCTPILLSGEVPKPPPPPPPPPPGPSWANFAYGVPVCLGCQGVLLNGHPNNSGGLLPPLGAFSMQTALIGGSFFEYTINSSGFMEGSYTGPDCHCRLTLVGGGGPGATVNNVITLTRNGASVLALQGDQCYTSGNYDFFLTGGTNVTLRIELQGQATPDQTLVMTGSFSNIP